MVCTGFVQAARRCVRASLAALTVRSMSMTSADARCCVGAREASGRTAGAKPDATPRKAKKRLRRHGDILTFRRECDHRSSRSRALPDTAMSRVATALLCGHALASRSVGRCRPSDRRPCGGGGVVGRNARSRVCPPRRSRCQATTASGHRQVRRRWVRYQLLACGVGVIPRRSQPKASTWLTSGSRASQGATRTAEDTGGDQPTLCSSARHKLL